MKLCLNERERLAYITGDIQLAAELAEHIDTVSVVGCLISEVRDNVSETRYNRNLFEILDAVDSRLTEVIP